MLFSCSCFLLIFNPRTRLEYGYYSMMRQEIPWESFREKTDDDLRAMIKEFLNLIIR